MSTLANELLADLESLPSDNSEDEEEQQKDEGRAQKGYNDQDEDNEDMNEEEEEDEEETARIRLKRNRSEMEGEDGDDNNDQQHDTTKDEKEKEEKEALLLEIQAAEDVEKVSKLRKSKRYIEIIQQVKQGFEMDEQCDHLLQPANNLIPEIEAEIYIVHKFIRDHYHSRFPELDGLVMNPTEYAKAVKLIQNDLDVGRYDLRSFLPSATVMVVAVSASATKGQVLDQAALLAVIRACDHLLDLDGSIQMLSRFIASRMHVIAPNLVLVIGSTIAAKLMGIAGGLSQLSKVPACNLIAMGASRKTLAGFSIANIDVRAGAIRKSEVVSKCPSEFIKKAMRMVSSKVALAARVDATKQSPDGAVGRDIRAEIEKKIQLWLNPPANKEIKALPIPNEVQRKRRGGRKARAYKKKFQMTETRKLANRTAFGQEEQEITGLDGELVGVGMTTTGKVRKTVDEGNQKFKAPKLLKKKMPNVSGTHTVSGIASSLSFTPVQGIELIDPIAAKRKVQSANDRYFGTMTPFGQ